MRSEIGAEVERQSNPDDFWCNACRDHNDCRLRIADCRLWILSIPQSAICNQDCPLSQTSRAPVSPHITAAIVFKLARNDVQLSSVTRSSEQAGETCAAARNALVAVCEPHIGAITAASASSLC